MPNTPASTRSARRPFVAVLDTGETPDMPFVVEEPIEYSFGIRQCLRSVHVLPLSIADFQGTQAPFVRQLPHAVGERTVSIPRCRLEPAKKSRAAQEHPGIERVVVGDFLSNIHDTIPVAPNLGSVVEIKNAIGVGIHSENHFAGL